MELELNGLKLELFSGISDMTWERFSHYNRMVMLDSELGSTLSDYQNLIVRINQFIDKEMLEEAKGELINMMYVVKNILDGTSHKGLAFATLIKKFDGKIVDDYTEENLKKILKKLSDKGLDVKTVLDKTEEVKKK